MQAGTNGSKPTGGSPQRRPEPRLRRNSDSSVMEKPVTDEERRIREMRQRDRERRHRDGKNRPRKLDIIDQLDATSIYGTGCEVTLSSWAAHELTSLSSPSIPSRWPV